MRPEPPPDNACLFLDVDGTLIDIAPTPETVVVPTDLIGDLVRAEERLGGALALVSGRTIADLDRLFAPLTLRASGVHGSEFRFGKDPKRLWIKAAALPEDGWIALSALLAPFPRVFAENKLYSYAVHFRAAPQFASGLRLALEGFLAKRPDLGLQILDGHCVYDLKRPDVDKGAAIEHFMARPPFLGRRPIFIGDDVTDTPGFHAVRELGGRAYSVSDVLPDVTGTFADPAAVRSWLASIDHSEAVTA